MVEEKMRIPIAQGFLANIIYLLRLKMEEAYVYLHNVETLMRSFCYFYHFPLLF
ncbi:unnamed protein product [Brassica oleracea]